MKYSGFSNKKSMTALIAAAGVTVVVAATMLFPTTVKSEFDIDGLNSQIQNHEARIGNTEKDVEKLQNETGVTPAENKTAVPVTTTTTNTTPPPAASSPAPPATETTTPPPAAIVAAPFVETVTMVGSSCPGGPYYVWHYNDGHQEKHDTAGGKRVAGTSWCTDKVITL